jgi:Stress responsive A/B Barrel Domain
MFFHVFGFKWKPEATEAQKAQVVVDVEAFKGVVPGLIEVHMGHNESPRGLGYTFAGVMRFTGKAAFEAYMVHPAHEKLLVWLRPIIEPVELDFLAID